MNRRSPLPFLVVLALFFSLLAGCTRDPSVLKRRHFARGEDYFKAGKYSEAIIEYSRAIQYDKEYADAHYGLGRTYMKLATYSAAYVELARTVELAPKNLDAHVDIGVLLLANGNYDTAKDHAEFVLDENPDHVPARILLANVQAALGEMDKAFQEMNKAISIDPNRAVSYLNLAILQGSAGQLQPAEQNFKKAIAMDPKSIAPLMAMGEFYEQLRRGPEAEDLFRRAMALDSNDPRPRQAVVRILLEQGKAADAEKMLQDAAKSKDDLESLRDLANFYIQIGDLGRATSQYASIHQRFPKDTRSTKFYAQLLIFDHRLPEAEKLVNAVLDANSRDSDASLMRAQIFIEQGKNSEGADLLDKLIAIEPENALAHHYLGMALEKMGNRQRAENEWREAARLRPGMLEARAALAQVALQSQNYELLEKSVTELISAQPNSPRWYVYRAMAKMQTGELLKAEEDLIRAMQVGPRSPMGFSKMGVLRLKQKRYKEADQYFEQALDRDSAYFEALQGLTDSLMEQKKADDAISRIRAQLTKQPNNTHFYYLLGSAYLRLGEKAQAEAALKQSVAADGGNVDSLVVLAGLFYERGAVQSAMDDYEQAIRTHPRDPRAYVLLGSIYEYKGNYDKAQELYEQALRVQPDYPMAANNLAYLLLQRNGNLDYAASLAQVARKAMPESVSAADTLGWAYYKKGAYSLAIDLLEEATKKSPSDATFHYHLGMAYQGAHDRDRARTHLQKALQLAPQSEHAAEIQQNLKKLERG